MQHRDHLLHGDLCLLESEPLKCAVVIKRDVWVPLHQFNTTVPDELVETSFLTEISVAVEELDGIVKVMHEATAERVVEGSFYTVVQALLFHHVHL